MTTRKAIARTAATARTTAKTKAGPPPAAKDDNKNPGAKGVA
jgi:hypothetical protein